jgi:asparagine synthase (glutamine-hydrolysing)
LAFFNDEIEGRAFRDECLQLMNRVSLQRIDRCSMRHQVEMREPFLDPAVVTYALGLDAAALVNEVDGLPRGKAPLRDIYDLYSGLPRSIRDRAKIPFGEGAGLDVAPQDSTWKRRFNDVISDAELLDGRVEFSEFNIQSKEELHYIRHLNQVMDISRVPHLRDRAWISFSVKQNREKLESYAYFSL